MEPTKFIITMDQQGSEPSEVSTEVLKLTKPVLARPPGLSIRQLIDFLLPDHLFFLLVRRVDTGKFIYLWSLYELIQGAGYYSPFKYYLVYLAKGHSQSRTNQWMYGLSVDEDAYQKSLLL